MSDVSLVERELPEYSSVHPLTAHEEVALARLDVQRRQEERATAEAENKKISKIPLKLAGGGKRAKAKATATFQEACRAEEAALETLRTLEKLLSEADANTNNGANTNTTNRDANTNTANTNTANTNTANTNANATPINADANTNAKNDVAPTGGSDPTGIPSGTNPESTKDANANPASMLIQQARVGDSEMLVGESEKADGEEATGELPHDTEPDPILEKPTAPHSDPNMPEETTTSNGKKGTAEAKTDASKGKKRLPKTDKVTEGGKKPKKAKVAADDDDNARVEYEFMDDKARDKLEKEGRAAVEAFLTKKTAIPFKYRRLIRDCQTYLPEAGTISRELSCHILQTNRSNSICLFHQHHRSAPKIRDGFNNGTKHILVGIPYGNTVSSSSKESQPLPEGYMSCGCHNDVALLDFFWWKTWVLKSPRTDWDYSEGMGSEVTAPRVRAFFVSGFLDAMGMTLDDLYACKAGSLGYDAKVVRMYQLKCMLDKVNEYNDREGIPRFAIGSLTPDTTA